MTSIISIAALIAVAAITPGPNNLVVMAQASAAGVAGTARSVGAIVIGGAAMVGLAKSLASLPLVEHAVPWVALAGAALLALLAVQQAFRAGSAQPSGAALKSPLALLAFQWINPKAWIMATLIASAGAASGYSSSLLVGLFAIISATCLSIWALGGRTISVWASTNERRKWAERALAAALFATAAQMAFSQLGEIA